MKNENRENTRAFAEVRERVRLTEWQRQIEERQSNGISIEEWCRQREISIGTYYYKLRKVRAYLCRYVEPLSEKGRRMLREDNAPRSEERRIVPIQVSKALFHESNVCVTLGDLRITFSGEVSSEILKTVIEVLRSC